MIIKIWGSRGSIPVSGKEYLKYGGDTTCLEIRTKSGDIIIVDAGTGIRRLGNQLAEEKCRDLNFIFTHAHWDHLMGFPFFKPLYCKSTRILLHRCPYHSKFVETILSKLMAPPNFPVKYADITAQLSYPDACPMAFEIGSVSVVPVALSHPNGGSGYKFIEDGRCFVFLTDNELGYIHPGGLPSVIIWNLPAMRISCSMMPNIRRRNIKPSSIGGTPCTPMRWIWPKKPG